MARDKKKKSAEQKAAKQAKQSKKTAKSEKKVKAKNADADSDADENVDLDAVLAAFAEQQAKFLKVTEQPCSPPSPRSSATLLASPSNRNELFLFGGEYYDGASASFYNDLFVYQINQGEWRKVTSPNSPLPRSGHAWCRGGNTGGIYLFGGEFSSPKQGTFYHYNDFWHLDPDTREWTRLESKGKNQTPPQRSGHRMTYWKNFIILFGGFQDTSQQTKYLQDTWVYDIRENVWHEFRLPPASQKPDPRSSFSWLPHDSGAVLFGGYSRVKAAVKVRSGKQQNQQQQKATRNVLKPMIHQDSWFLRMSLPSGDIPPGTCPILRWERRKTPANSMNPARAGITMAYHKGRGVLFGGVHDKEDSEEAIESEFFQSLFVYNIDRNRMFPISLRRPKTGNKSKAPRTRNRGKADEEELLRNLAALETKGKIADEDDVEMKMALDEDDDAQSDRKEFPVKFEFPHARFNALLTVQDDTLFVYGGTFERKDVEITFSDLYALDLNKLEGVKELYYIEPENMNAVMDESEEEDEDEDEEMDDADSDESETEEIFSPDNRSVAASDITDATSVAQFVAEPEVEAEKLASQDPRPFPRPFENRAEFFRRTTNEWQKYILDYVRDAASLSVKELRERAFQQAEERWWDCREEIQALEDEQEASGIGDVVSLADRAEGGGGGRRR